MNIDERLLEILQQALKKEVSDVHISPGQPVYYRVQGLLAPALGGAISTEVAEAMARSLLTTVQLEQLQTRGSVDGAISLDSESRFRFNIYRRDAETCFAFRLLPSVVASLGELGLSDRLYDLSNLKDGLVLVAGPTGSGKSTTIASLVNRINFNRCCHIITIEDPVEFVHRSRKSLVNQRQVGPDVATFNQALLDAVRQDPDVILVGELRDEDTIRTAITAAETGHLVFASIHAGDCKTAIERLAGAYSAGEQNLAQRLIATVIRAIVVQHLLPRYQNPNLPATENEASKRVLASEVMFRNSAIANLIAKANLNQIASVIETCGDEGMWTLDQSLAELWRKRLISEVTAQSLARNPAMLSQLTQRANRA